MPRIPSDDELQELMQMLQGVLSPGDFLPDPAFEDPDELRRNIAALPLRPEVNWLGFIEPMDLGSVPVPAGFTPHLAVLMRPEGPEASLSELAEDREEAELMMLQDILEPDDEEVEIYRPGVLLVPDVQQAFALGNFLREAGIRVEVEPTGHLLGMRDQILSQFAEEAAGQMAQMQPQPLLTGLSDEQVRDFVEAFRQFDRAEAWEVVEPDKPISATWTDMAGPDTAGTDTAGESRTIYATAMGDMGQSFGLVFFADWLAYAEQMNNSFNPELVVSGLGGMEAVTEGEQADFTAEDWARLRGLGLLTDDQTAPLLQRLGLEGNLPPRTPIVAVTAILQVLAQRAGKKPGARATSIKGVAGKGATGSVQVRYPGKPQDELRPEELTGTITFTLTGGYHVEKGKKLTITGPSGETMRALEKAINKPRWVKADDMTVLPDHFTRPVLMGVPQPGHAVLGEDLAVWQSQAEFPTSTLAQFTRRTGLEWDGAQVSVAFSPEPCEGFSWSLKKA